MTVYMLKKPSPEKIYNFLKKYYRWILGIIFALLICLNVLVYYQYIYLTIKSQPELILDKVTIDQETLQNVLDNLEMREESLWRVKHTHYTDPFR
jgi:hypothetical protein